MTSKIIFSFFFPFLFFSVLSPVTFGKSRDPFYLSKPNIQERAKLSSKLSVVSGSLLGVSFYNNRGTALIRVGDKTAVVSVGDVAFGFEIVSVDRSSVVVNGHGLKGEKWFVGF